MSIFSRSSFLLIPLMLAGHSASADEYHYNNMLIGDRASGMGGAYTAVSDDATGLYYNPAAIVYVGDRNFSASVNAYYNQSKRYENVFGNKPFERNSTALLANFFGIVKPIGNVKVGLSYAVPDAVSENQNQSFANIDPNTPRYTINLSNRDVTYNVGPSIAVEINNELSMGLTLYGHQRQVQLILNQYTEAVSGATVTNQWINKYYNLSETGVRPVLGVMWSPLEKLSLGLSLSQTIVLASTASNQDTCWITSGSCNPSVSASPVQTPTFFDTTAKRKYPVRVALGAAYFPSSSLLISTDLTYNSAVVDRNFYTSNKVATINGALGAEYYLSKQWAVRAGIYSNISNSPNIQAGVTTIEEQINLYGVSFSVSNFSGGSSVTVGTSVNYGKGKSQITGDLNSVQDASTLGWLLFLSSSY